LSRNSRGVNTIRRTKLRYRFGQVVPHGPFAKPQLARNFCGSLAISSSLEDLTLAII
jgi:hypothetical protein